MSSITFIPGKRKYLILTDSFGMPEAEVLIREAITKSVEYQFVQFEGQIDTLRELLSSQKMGTFLYFFGSWQNLKHVKGLAEECGFTADEALYKGIGQLEKRIFCCRCHGISLSRSNEKELSCPQCGLLLEISDHYSPLRDAYLGYPLKL